MELENDRTTWVWVPLKSFGPFKFGSPFDDVPYTGEIVEADRWESTEYLRYSSTLPAVNLTSWNNRLAGVGVTDIFVVEGVNLIGSNFQDVRQLLPGEPIIENLTNLLFVSYDDLDLMLSLDIGWVIRSVDVGIDPDTLESPSQ